MPKAKAGKKELTVRTQNNGNGQLAIYSREAVTLLKRKTPIEFQAKHPSSGLIYVEIGYVRRCVQEFAELVGAQWSFETEEISNMETILKLKHIVVKGRLMLQMKDGSLIVREAFGGADVLCYKNTHPTKANQPLDLGNGYKSATSDAFKKCASSFGIAQDIFEPKVEKKVDSLEKKAAAAEVATDGATNGATEGQVVDAEVVTEDEDARINMDQIKVATKIRYSKELEGKITKYMEHAGISLVSKMTVKQFKDLLDWAPKNGMKEPLF